MEYEINKNILINQQGENIMLFEKKKKLTLKIDGMHCEKCSAKVDAALMAARAKAEVDLKLGRAAVTCPEKIADDVLVKAVEACGFDCRVL